MFCRFVKRILRLSIAGVLLLSGITDSVCQEYYYEVNTTPLKGELSNFLGRCIMQDSEGFMWFGSEDGLYRYDGSMFKVFRNNPGDSTTLSCDIITNLIEDQNGIMWITGKRGLNRFNKRTETFTRYLPVPDDSTSLRHPNIREITFDREGTNNLRFTLYNIILSADAQLSVRIIFIRIFLKISFKVNKYYEEFIHHFRFLIVSAQPFFLTGECSAG